MYRGTTPTNTFTSELDLSNAVVVYITYKQNKQVVFEKGKEDITFSSDDSNYVMSIELTQEETLKLSPNNSVAIQIRARFADGNAVASNIITTSVAQILKEGVI